MPVDLFEKNGIDPYAENQPRDLFAENGINPYEQEGPKTFLDKAKDYIYSMANANTNAVIGVGDAINNFPRQLANMIMPESEQIPILKQGEGSAYATGEFGGDLANLLLGGGALNAVRKSLEGSKYLGQAAKWLGGQNIPQTMARLGVGMAPYGAVMTPENRTMGALLTGGLGALGGGASAGISKLLNPSTYIKPGTSIDKLKENIRIAGNTDTPIGDVVESPYLKRFYENILSKNPFSGVDEKMSDTAKMITDNGNNILNKYLKNTAPEEVDDEIGKSLFKAHIKQQNLKNSLYNKSEELANGEGAFRKNALNLEFPEFSENVRKYNSIINDKEFLQYDPELKNILKKIMTYKGNVTLKDANVLSGKLNSLSREHGASPSPDDRNLSKIFKELGSSLKGDIRKSIENSGNKELKESYEKAESNYKKNFVPFLDKDIYKFTHGDKSAEDILQTFIKTGNASDKGGKLSKLMSKLDPRTQDLVKYSYLSRSLRGPENERYVDPNALKTLWGDTKLGQKQKKSLFHNQSERKELDDYSKLVGMNSESLGRMFNPKTGQRNLDIGMLLGHSLGGSTGGAVGYHEGGFPGFLAGTATGLLAPGILSKYLANKMTSQSVRKKLLDELTSAKKVSNNKTGAISGAVARRILNMYMTPNTSSYSFE